MFLPLHGLEGGQLLAVDACIAIGVVFEDGEDEPDKVDVHGLVAGLGGQVHVAGVDCDVGLGVVLTQHSHGAREGLGELRPGYEVSVVELHPVLLLDEAPDHLHGKDHQDIIFHTPHDDPYDLLLLGGEGVGPAGGHHVRGQHDRVQHPK